MARSHAHGRPTRRGQAAVAHGPPDAAARPTLPGPAGLHLGCLPDPRRTVHFARVRRDGPGRRSRPRRRPAPWDRRMWRPLCGGSRPRTMSARPSCRLAVAPRWRGARTIPADVRRARLREGGAVARLPAPRSLRCRRAGQVWRIPVADDLGLKVPAAAWPPSGSGPAMFARFNGAAARGRHASWLSLLSRGGSDASPLHVGSEAFQASYFLGKTMKQTAFDMWGVRIILTYKMTGRT